MLNMYIVWWNELNAYDEYFVIFQYFLMNVIIIMMMNKLSYGNGDESDESFGYGLISLKLLAADPDRVVFSEFEPP